MVSIAINLKLELVGECLLNGSAVLSMYFLMMDVVFHFYYLEFRCGSHQLSFVP